MKTHLSTSGLAVTLMFMVSCSSSGGDRECAEPASADSLPASGYLSSAAAKEKEEDPSRKFIRTADLKFRVKNVYRSTVIIEDVALREGGFITLSDLRSTVENTRTVPFSADSSLELTSYSVHGTLTLRVPNTKLDTVLKQIASQIDFLDYRVIRANDAKLLMLGNTLTCERMKKHEERLTQAIDDRGRKLNETTQAEENLLSKQEQADRAAISNLSLSDQVSFSTLSLQLYQQSTLKKEKLDMSRNMETYKPGLFIKLRDAFLTGWGMLEAFALLVVKLWGLLLLLLAGWLIYTSVFRKQ